MSILIPAVVILPGVWLLASSGRVYGEKPKASAVCGIVLCAAASVIYLSALMWHSRFF